MSKKLKNKSYENLYNYSFSDLRDMALDMDLRTRRSKEEYIADITEAFKEYERYKREKVDKYKKIRQLGNTGKEGTTYLVKDTKGHSFAMKTFRKTKSSETLKNEYYLQKKCASVGVSPRLVEYDSVSKYIVMEKMDCHLTDVMKKNKGRLLKKHQLEIIDLFRAMDDVGVFHGDSNILNYMIKNDRIYLIDFGFAKEITSKLVRKLGTETPNFDLMNLGLILKLKELDCDPYSWKYLRRYVRPEELEKFQI